MKRQFNFTGDSFFLMKSNHQHAQALRHALMNYRANAIYSYIPKNACTAMRYSLAIENGCIEGSSQFNWIHLNNDTFIASNREALLASFTFVILRCPFRRVYSAFMDKFVNMDIQSWEIHNASQRAIHPHDIRFVDFISMLKKPRLLNLNHHWRPQWTFLLFKEYDAYYSVEDFATLVRDLEERIDFTVYDIRGLTGHSIKAFDKIDDGAAYDKMTAFDILRMKREGKLPSEKAMFTNEMIAAVSEIYKQDIELYKSRIGTENLLFE